MHLKDGKKDVLHDAAPGKVGDTGLALVELCLIGECKNSRSCCCTGKHSRKATGIIRKHKDRTPSVQAGSSERYCRDELIRYSKCQQQKINALAERCKL